MNSGARILGAASSLSASFRCTHRSLLSIQREMSSTSVLARHGESLSCRNGAVARTLGFAVGLSDPPEGATCSDVVKADSRRKFGAVSPRLAKRRQHARQLLTRKSKSPL